MGVFYAGILFIGIGTALMFWRKKKQRELFEIKATQTSTVRDLTDTCKSINEELGTTGGFKQQAEVKGAVKCDKPLIGEMSKLPCVYFETKVTEERRVSDGKWETHTVSLNTQRVNFYVQDQTGTILVNPNEASIDPLQVASKYKQKCTHTEKIIPLERKVYVLGEASDSSGQLMIQAPSEKGKPFIITLKSEEELTRATESMIHYLMIGAIASWIFGAANLAYWDVGARYGLFGRW